MNYEAAILYGHQLMREIGKKEGEYHFEPVYVFPIKAERDAGVFIRNAFNEVYILVNPENYFGLFIAGSNTAFLTEKPWQNGTQAFTGQILFKKVAPGWSFSTEVSQLTPCEFVRFVY